MSLKKPALSQIGVFRAKKQKSTFFSNIFLKIWKLVKKGKEAAEKITLESEFIQLISSFFSMISPWYRVDMKKGILFIEVMNRKFDPYLPPVFSEDKGKVYEFSAVMAPAIPDEESYFLYKKYSGFVHKKPNETIDDFNRFLCLNNFQNTSLKTNDNLHELKQGLFHRKYYLNKKLIAISVLEIMKEGMECYYFMYDPEYKDLSLGVVSINWEI